MAHLLSQLERGPERDYALIAIGHTATAVGADMKPFLETIMSHIKARLKDAASQAMAASGGASARRQVIYLPSLFLHSRGRWMILTDDSLRVAARPHPPTRSSLPWGCWRPRWARR